MASVTRLAPLTHDIGDLEYVFPKTPDSDYIVDDSSFVPMKEAIKQLSAVGVSSDSLKPYYDFQDGEDTGIEIPITRTKNGKDIAEISSHIMEQVDELSDKVNKAKEFEKFKQDKAAEMQSMKNNVSTTPEA